MSSPFSQRWLVIITLLLLVGGGTAAILYSQNQTRELEKARLEREKSAKTTQLVGNNVSFTITEGDKKRWDIHVIKVIYSKDQSNADLYTIDGKLYDDSGKVSATFTAPNGTFAHQPGSPQKLKLFGGVTLKSVKEEDETELVAPQLDWVTKEKEILTQGGVKLTKKDTGTSTADRCRFTMDFAFVSLEGNTVSEMTF